MKMVLIIIPKINMKCNTAIDCLSLSLSLARQRIEIEIYRNYYWYLKLARKLHTKWKHTTILHHLPDSGFFLLRKEFDLLIDHNDFRTMKRVESLWQRLIATKICTLLMGQLVEMHRFICYNNNNFISVQTLAVANLNLVQLLKAPLLVLTELVSFPPHNIALSACASENPRSLPAKPAT